MTDMKRNKSDKQQVTFRLYVDRLDGEFVNKKRLMPETTYYFGRFEKRAEYSDVVRYLQAVVDHELAYELRKYIDDDDLEVIVKDTFVGSIELLFSVLINTLIFDLRLLRQDIDNCRTGIRLMIETAACS